MREDRHHGNHHEDHDEPTHRAPRLGRVNSTGQQSDTGGNGYKEYGPEGKQIHEGDQR